MTDGIIYFLAEVCAVCACMCLLPRFVKIWRFRKCGLKSNMWIFSRRLRSGREKHRNILLGK